MTKELNNIKLKNKILKEVYEGQSGPISDFDLGFMDGVHYAICYCIDHKIINHSLEGVNTSSEGQNDDN